MKTTCRRPFSTIEPLESRIAPAVILVTTVADTTNTNHTTGSLRDALALADADLVLHPGVINTIEFKLPPAAAHTENIITLGGAGVLTSNGDVNIIGPGPGKLIINGNAASGVFDFSDASTTKDSPVSISGLSILNGKAANGAGILSTDSLALKNVIVSGNTATSLTAGVTVDGSATIGTKVSISNSLITGNSGPSGGGIGLYTLKSFSVTSTVISGNTDAGGAGGGLYAGLGADGATGLIAGCVISGNSAAYGGGVDLRNGSALATSKITISGTKMAGNNGGGLNFAGHNFVITGSTFENNTEPTDGGGIDALSFASVTISNCIVTGNSTSGTTGSNQGGGGIFIQGSKSATPVPIQIVHSVISDNRSALDGGGIFAYDGVDLSVTGSTISGNNAASGIGGGLATRGNTAAGVVNLTVTGSLFSANISDRGGAIAAQGAPGLEGDGSFSVTASKITGNASLGADGGINVATSAAVTIANTAVTNNFATAFAGGLDIIDSHTIQITGGSISGNTAIGVAGGLRLFGVTGTIAHATITGNSAGTNGGGVYQTGGGTVTIESSSIFANTAPSNPDIDGSLTFA